MYPLTRSTSRSRFFKPAAALPPAPTISVLDSAGTSYTVTLTVLNSSGAGFVVSNTVLSSGGTAYNV
jgi:hypothetical protein